MKVNWRQGFSWRLFICVLALFLAVPVLTIVFSLLLPMNANWEHVASYLLSDYIWNSLLLMVGVALGVTLIGVSTAWLTTMYEFPGRAIFAWALLLPLAMPAYIVAYTYTGILDYAGPVQTSLRQLFDWGYGSYWFPDIRSLGGAVFVLTFVLFPYVYMLARAAFIEQSICVLEVSRSLGCTAWQSIWRVALPLARPAIVAGVSLALMETLADYGTVQYFGLSTFTTGIFRVWFGMGDVGTASQLAAVLLFFVVTLLMLERFSRHKARFHHTSHRYSELKRRALTGWRRWSAVSVCALPLMLGFVFPALQLLYWAVTTAETSFDYAFLLLVWHSLYLATVTALAGVVVAVVFAYGKRLLGSSAINAVVRLSGLGYAIPGIVIAVGIMVPVAWFDNTVDTFARETFSKSTGLILSGSLFVLVLAYLVRFLSISLQTVESGLEKVKPTMDDVARTLGYTPLQVLRRIHFPIMKGSLLTALLLVFVDVLKELPATLILRPFNYNTLAVRAYELAADERLADVGAPALMIVLVGIIPVILLTRVIDRVRVSKLSSRD